MSGFRSFLHERRDKNTIYFSLNHEFIKRNASAAENLIYRKDKGRATVMGDGQSAIKESVLNNFLTKEGKLKVIPAQLKKKLIVLEHLVSKLEMGKKYDEKEINAFIQNYHGDYATIRREFIMHHFMFRENQIYELNPPEMWARWETLA